MENRSVAAQLCAEGAPPAFQDESSLLPRHTLVMHDEVLDYYAWIYSQSGLTNLHLTFEQFLIVVATLWPSKL